MAQHVFYIVFLFAFGACVGSFLNVVVWRVPRGESLVTPPSHCPKCNNRLRWYDNIPVLGWIKLRGKCRFCGLPISPRYPIVEAVTGGLLVLYYVLFFVFNIGPCAFPGRLNAYGMPVRELVPLTWSRDWDVYALYMVLLCVLLAGSLIDAEHYILPIEMFWVVVVPAALAMHAFQDVPGARGALNVGPAGGAMAAGGLAGWLVSLLLAWRGLLPTAFAEGAPALEVERESYAREQERAKNEGKELAPHPDLPEYTPSQIRAEIRKEIPFLLPPMALAVLFTWLALSVGPVARWWSGLMTHHWLTGLLGSVLGMLVGGFVVWVVRILGTAYFGRDAMGMGDVHLMAGVGAVIGAGASVVSFFLAPFFGLVLAVYLLFTGKRRELPYGPYLSMGTAFVMLFYCPIAAYLAPGMAGLRFFVGRWFGAEAGSGDAPGAGF